MHTHKPLEIIMEPPQIHEETSIAFPSLEEINQIGRYYSHRWGKSQKYASSVEKNYKQLKKVWSPLILWKILPIKKMGAEGLEFPAEIHMGNHFVSHFLETATSAMVGFATIGHGCDQWLATLTKERLTLDKVIADIIGNILIGKLCSDFLADFKRRQLTQGFFTTNSIAPGEATWEITDQQIFAHLLRWERHKVSLSPYMVISPSKSETFIVGRSREQFPRPDDSRCNYCQHQDACRFYSKLLMPGYFCQ